MSKNVNYIYTPLVLSNDINLGVVEKVVKIRNLYFVSFVLSFVNLCGSEIYV